MARLVRGTDCRGWAGGLCRRGWSVEMLSVVAPLMINNVIVNYDW